MGTEKVQGAASGAAAGAKIGSAFGPVGTGIGAIAGGIIGAFSSKGSYAQTTGIEVSGSVSKSGFSGEAYGLSQNGAKQYRDRVDPNNAQSPWWHIQANLAEGFKAAFGADSNDVVPVSLVIPEHNFGPTLQSYVKSFAAPPDAGLSFGGPGMTAPRVTQDAATFAATGGASTFATSGGALPMGEPAVRADWQKIIPLLLGAGLLVKAAW